MNTIQIEEGERFHLSERDAEAVLEHLGNALTWSRDGLVIWGVVGHLQLPSGNTLRITSVRAPKACVLSWASYVNPMLSEVDHLRHLDDVAGDGDVAEALARLFVRELRDVVGTQGLKRRYHRETVLTSTVRGTIDFNRLVRNGGDVSRVPCTTWTRILRTPLNQFLAAAIDVIAKDTVLRSAVGSSLRELQAAFAEIPPGFDADFLRGRRKPLRNEQDFERAYRLAQLVLAGAGLGSGTDRRGVGFIVDIAPLFERSVVKALQDGELNVTAQHPLRYERGESNGTFFIDAFVKGQTNVVVDAKYKRQPSNENLQQMVTYCHLTGATRAVLVFPSGQLRNKSAFVFRSPTGPTVNIELIEFDSTGRTVAEWRRNGAQLAQRIAAIAQ